MKTVLTVEGMSCGHCVKYIKETLEALDGVASVTVSLENKEAVIEHDNTVSFEDLKRVVKETGYETVLQYYNIID